MKFVCDKCQAHYLIADEKVGTRGVKVKCKKCGNVIVVRPGAQAAEPKADADGDAADAAKSLPRQVSGILPAVAEANRTSSSAGVVAAKSSSRQTAPPPPPPDDDATLINNLGDLNLGDMARKAEAALGGPTLSDDVGSPAMFEDGKVTAPGMGLPDLSDPVLPPEHPAEPPPEPPAGPSPEPPPEAAAALPPPEASDAAEPPAPQAPPSEDSAGPTGDLENELAGAFDGLFGGEPRDIIPGSGPGPDGDRAPTRVYSSEQEELARSQKESNGANGHAQPAAEGTSPGEAVAPSVEWYAAINDEQRGPFNLSDMETHWLRGDVDAESLVWRTGMPDWVPLAEVRDLKYLLDLAPQRKSQPPPTSLPPMAGAPGLTASGMGLAPAMDDVSEEAWRPRGMTSVYRAASAAESGMGMESVTGPPPPEAPPPEDPSWTPSAASSLAALVDDELSALKTKQPTRQAEPAFKPPPAEDDSVEAPILSLVGSSAPLPSLSLPPVVDSPGEAAPFVPEPARGGATPLPFRPGQPSGMAPGLKLGLIIGGAVTAVVLAVVGGVVIGTRVAAPEDTPAEAPVAAANPSATGTDQTPPASGGAAAGNNASGTEAAPATAAVPEHVAAKEKDPTPAKADDKDPEERSPRRASRRESRRAAARDKPEKADKPSRFAAVADDKPEREARPERAKPEARKPSKSECDPILYPEGCEDKPTRKAAAPAGKESLSKTDVLLVVKNNKGDITRCVAAQRKRDADLASGVLKMRWSIRKDGRTSSVAVAGPSQYASAYVGKCLTRAIQGWKFPAYSGDAMPPINFPLKLDQF